MALVGLSDAPTYVGVGDKAFKLSELGMNPNRIAEALHVDRTTVVRGLRWIMGTHIYPKTKS